MSLSRRALAALCVAGAAALLHGPVTFDERSLMVGGERELFLSGAVHYPRVRPADWGKVFKLAKEMGLNTIQTYVFWNIHEPHLADRGNASWSGWADLPAFIRQAEENELYVSLRIGPYVCGEYYFGGLPVWLRDFGGVKCFRCQDPVWEAEMQRWVTEVVELVRPQLQPRGNIMMLQIENEFGGDQQYLNWAVDMAASLTEKEVVPWNLCHAYHTCFATNNRNGTYDFKTLCAMNGFWMEEYVKDPDQPAPKFLEDLRVNNPGQPAMWTEDQGWFDQWGKAKRIRYSSDQLYGIARWFAWGGSYHNFYMLTGGNNYGFKSGGEVTTAYAPDTVISPFLLKHQPRFDYYQHFFQTLNQYKHTLLSSPVAKAQRLPSNSSEVQTAAASLQPCTDTDPAHVGKLDASQLWDFDGGLVRSNFSGRQLCIDALNVTNPPALLPCDKSAASQQFTFDPSSGQLASIATGPCQVSSASGTQCHRCLDMGHSGAQLSLWDCSGKNPENQVFTLDGKGGLRPNGHKDNCLTGAVAGGGQAELHAYGEFSFLSNTGTEPLEVQYLQKTFALKGQSVALIDAKSKSVVLNTGDAVDPDDQEPLVVGFSKADKWEAFQESPGYGAQTLVDSAPREQLNLTENDWDYLWYSASIPSGLSAEDIKVSTSGGSMAYVHIEDTKLHILSVAMGLSNGGVGPDSHKGVSAVKVAGRALETSWTHSWVLKGEEMQIFEPASSDAVPWVPYSDAFESTAVTWLRASLDVPHGASLSDPTVAFAVELSSMSKGVAYVNGFNLGRYWSKVGTCSGSCAPPVKNGHCYMHWKDCDKPTQTMYHVPSDVLKAKGNLLVLFEEAAPGTLTRSPGAVRLVTLQAKDKTLLV